ncbi:MAG: MaoC family dehydratase [Deltaproteobacteria bacterium]|nr:MaoC family dehydratase [Deltaproteobacteria bacterium]
MQNIKKETDSVVTEELKTWCGRTLGPIPLPERISESDLRRYINATGDRNSLWLDDEFARSVGYRGRVIPPMMVAELYRRSEGSGGTLSDNLWEAMPLPENYTESRNAQAEFEWLEPVYLGDRLSVTHRIVDIVSRSTRAGMGIFVTREIEFQRERGEIVLRVRQTSVKLPKRKPSGEKPGEN